MSLHEYTPAYHSANLTTQTEVSYGYCIIQWYQWYKIQYP